MQHSTHRPTDHAHRSSGTLATGVALVIMMVSTFIVNGFAGGDSAPGPDATTEEIVTFLRHYRAGLQWDLALRFFILAVLFLPVGIGLARHVRGGERTWLLPRMIPHLAVWLMAVGAIANTVQGMLLFEGDRLLDEPAVARILLLAITALYLLAMLPHGAIIGVVSEAGRRTRTLPIWLSGLGYLVSVVCLFAVLTMPLSLGFVDSSAPGVAAGVAYGAIGPWYLITGIVLIVKARRQVRTEPVVVADDDPSTAEPLEIDPTAPDEARTLRFGR